MDEQYVTFLFFFLKRQLSTLLLHPVLHWYEIFLKPYAWNNLDDESKETFFFLNSLQKMSAKFREILGLGKMEII